ncbi:MAG: BolA family transcriptional regulator [Rickettsiales bacterium]|jgi:stress-induced morphogen|nr:BolA family transcriptional regulator [Rickettsiales bacterium]
MTVSTKEIKNLLVEKLPDSKIEVVDQLGDGYHYQIKVASPSFQNISKLKQHRYVMDALKEYLKEKIHAVSISTEAL